MYKTLRSIEKAIDKAVDILFVLVLIIGIYYVVDSYIVFQDADANNVAAYRPTKEDASSLARLSPDCIAWLTIYDSGVDFPIMQGKDNTEYLNKDPYGAYSLSGSIFLDSRCDPQFTDDYSLVYGHHMSAGLMFGALDAFGDESFLDAHREGEIIVDGAYYKLNVFAFTQTDVSEGMVFEPDREGDRLAWIRENARIFREPHGSRIVALTTCKSPTSTIRTIVFATIEE